MTTESNNIILDGTLLGQLRAGIEDVFEIIEVVTPRKAPQGTMHFIGHLRISDSEAAYDLIAERWHAYDYLPIFRHYTNQQVLLVAQPGVIAPNPSNPWTNLWLAVATILSVWFTGAVVECQCFPATVDNWLSGLPMMMAMMAILLAHEFGHYFAARYHKVAVTLPYFIPLPLISPVGTLGAFIQLRSPFKTKKQLFDIGVAGPLGGLIFALPLIFWTVSQAEVSNISRGPLILSGSNDNTVVLWDMGAEKVVNTFDNSEVTINAIAFSFNGQTVITAGSDPMVSVWDTADAEEAIRLVGHADTVNSVAMGLDRYTLLTSIFGSSNPVIATGSSDQTARLWDASSGEVLQKFTGHTDIVNSVALAPNWLETNDLFSGTDSGVIATASSDKTARLWDTATGQELKRFDGHTGAVNSVAFSPNWASLSGGLFGGINKTIVTASTDQTACLWSGNTGREIRCFKGHTGSVKAAIFSPTDDIVATGGDDSTVRLWDVLTGQELLKLEGHTDVVNSVEFSADGQQLITASADQTIRLWDVATGNELQQFNHHRGAVNAASIQTLGSVLEGNSIFYLLVKYIMFGDLLPSFDLYAELPFLQEFFMLLIGDIPTGGGRDIFINSLGFAAWFGLFITAMNLIPVGQLDGGHVMYCLIGDKAKVLGSVLIGLMFVAGFVWWPGWLVWGFLAFFVIGVYHPPPLNDLVPLNPARKILAYIMIILVIIMFMPNPLQLL